MRNKHGEFIWYELMTPDIEGAKAFYEPLLGWKIGEKSDMPGMDYRMIGLVDGGMVGGVLALDKQMADGGARPLWVGYIGVDDVDAAIQGIRDAGGQIHMGPQDIPAGRLAMASDPQGAPFYVMRGAVDEVSTVYSVDRIGRCSWNELSSPDQKAALDFYMGLFGWANPESMPMGEMGDYRFLFVDDLRIGASVEQKNRPAYWLHYFRVASIARAVETVNAGGGTVMMGPHEVPEGDYIIIGTDPQGAQFALVGGA